MKRIFALMCVFAMLFMAVQASAADEVKIGVLSDLSGPTGTVGTPYAKGILDCVKWANDNGGVNGMVIKAIQEDYAYDDQKALTAYTRFLDKGIVALQGWGTSDTEALTAHVGKDQIPTLSASYSANLTDPKVAPYNFFASADYSTQMRAALAYLKESYTGDGAPKVAFVYPNHPYGKSPIQAGKDYAKELGFEIVGEENVSLSASDATAEMMNLMTKNPDFVWIGGTTPSAAVILKAAKQLGMNCKFFINIWGADEDMFKMAPGATAGHYSLQTAVIYSDESEGNTLIKQLTNGEVQKTHYMRGFASMLVMLEGMRRAAAAGEVTGPAIKDALETLVDFDTMGLTPPISYTAEDHRPNMAVKIYELGDDKMTLVTTKVLDRRMDWLGK